MDSKSLGFRGEQIARVFLERIGFTFISANIRILSGEIDLIMKDNDTIVFVEVKTRASTMAGNPLEAITPRKLAAISRMAECYMVSKKWTQKPSRIDAVGIEWREDNPIISHVRNLTG